MTFFIFDTEGAEDSPLTFGARIKRPNTSRNMELLTQGVVSSIEYKAYAKASLTLTDSGTLTVSDVVLDTPSSGDIWRSGGKFNFVATIPAVAFPDSGWYQVEVRINLTSGDPIDLWINHHALERLGS